MTAQAKVKMANGAPKLKDAALFRQQCYIDGKWVDADSGATIDVTNPATGEVLGTIPKLGREETARAVEAFEKLLLELAENGAILPLVEDDM